MSLQKLKDDITDTSSYYKLVCTFQFLNLNSQSKFIQIQIELLKIQNRDIVLFPVSTTAKNITTTEAN